MKRLIATALIGLFLVACGADGGEPGDPNLYRVVCYSQAGGVYFDETGHIEWRENDNYAGGYVRYFITNSGEQYVASSLSDCIWQVVGESTGE
jgi:hypothetical protein